VEFRVLGPVEATVDGVPLELGGPKERALLAILLLHANHAVPAAYLIDQLWQDQPPMTAPNLLHGHVSRLRRMLRRSEAGTTPGGIVMTKGQGYLLKLEPGQLDLDRFERLVARARQAMAEAAPQRAAACLTEALALWHGPALADIPRGPLVDAESARLEACRHAALEARIEADLACGRHSELVGELDALVAGYPTHERFRAQLMLALYRSGRQSEALRVYRDGRAVLAEELGLEPGPDLQRLERAILTADPSLAAASEPDRAAAATGPPRQLPPAVTGFTGRQDALASLLGMVRGEPGDGEVAIAVITGKPGVGKTALAVRAAHQLRPRFPDGQLYVDLRGVEPRPLEPSDVLADLLRALEVDGAAIPDGLGQRASLYRTLLADRRVLVVLDNAADEGQVRPLLPGGTGCAALVTSRPRLSGLEVSGSVVLDVLDPGQAVELLAKLAGPERVAAEPAQAVVIARRCGRLPLALRIAGAKLASRPTWRLAGLATRLGDEQHRLDELAAGDLEVRASFTLSYQGLGPGERRTFRLLGLLDSPDFAGWLADGLLGTGTDRQVERLVDANLLEAAGTDATGQARYRFHDLLRLFARERLREEEPPAAQRAALERALRTCLERARQADAQLGSDERRPGGWFAAEHACLVAAVEQAYAAGFLELTWELGLSLSGYFEVRSRWDDWSRTHLAALDAARQGGDRHAQAALLRRLGDLHLDQSRWASALACFDQCLPIFRELGDRRGEAKTLRSLGDAHREQSHWPEALACFDQCLPIFRELGDRREEAEVLRGLGIINRHQDRLDDALANFEQCMRLAAELGNRRWEAIARRSLGLVYRDQGCLDDARACLEQSLAAFRELPDQLWEAYTLTSLGTVHREQRRLDEARGLLEQSLAIFSPLADRSGEAYALHGLGDVLREEGCLDQASACLHRCAATFRELGDQRGEAYALFSLGLVERDQGRHDHARARFDHCLVVAEQLSLPRWQAQLREALATLP
jgi:DNA-binding SARP family transcriptional activator/tetratricopeptide (TPR) repeat protein